MQKCSFYVAITEYLRLESPKSKDTFGKGLLAESSHGGSWKGKRAHARTSERKGGQTHAFIRNSLLQ